MSKVKKLFSLVCSFVLCMSISLTAFAADSTTNTDTGKETGVSTRGVLSGYGNEYHNNGSSAVDYFDFQVTGSWSPWAGCTVKTEGFPSSAATAYRLVRLTNNGEINMFPDNSDRWLNGNDEDANIPLFNVSPGTYRLYYRCYFGDTGTVHCWVY